MLVTKSIALAVVAAGMAAGPTMTSDLSPWNPQVPFPFFKEGERHWPIDARPWQAGTRVDLVAREGKTVLAAGERLEFQGISIVVTPEGRLRVVARKAARDRAFTLEL